jgi:hypothetical protein
LESSDENVANNEFTLIENSSIINSASNNSDSDFEDVGNAQVMKIKNPKLSQSLYNIIKIDHTYFDSIMPG